MTTEEQARLEALEKEAAQLREKLRQQDAFIRRTFGPYLTEEVLEEVLGTGGELEVGGECRLVTILFCDLRQSTELSERMAPPDFIRMLNHFLEEMIELINAWSGNILGFAGDAIDAVFGAPQENPDSARDAVACAVVMQRRMKAVNEWNRAEGYPDLSMGIGIHTGEAILGNIGSHTRMKYDMIGRNVNLASRIESLTEGGQILISSETRDAAGDLVHIDPAASFCARPKGIREEVLVHDVIGFGSMRTPRAEG